MRLNLNLGVRAIILIAFGTSLAFSQVESRVSEAFPGQEAYPHLTFRAYPLRPISPKLSISAEPKQRLPFQEQLLHAQSDPFLGLEKQRRAKVESCLDEFLRKRRDPDLSPAELAKAHRSASEKLRSLLTAAEVVKLEDLSDRDLLYRYGPVRWMANTKLATASRSIDLEELGLGLNKKLGAVHTNAFRTLLTGIPEPARKELLEQIGEDLKVPLITPSLFAHELGSSSAAGWTPTSYYLTPIAQLSASARVKNFLFLSSPAVSRYFQTQFLIPLLSIELTPEQRKLFEQDFLSRPSSDDRENAYDEKRKWYRDQLLNDEQAQEIDKLERQFLCANFGVTRCLTAKILKRTPHLSADLELIRAAEEKLARELHQICVEIEDEVIDALCDSPARHPRWLQARGDRMLPVLEVLAFHLNNSKSDWPSNGHLD